NIISKMRQQLWMFQQGTPFLLMSILIPLINLLKSCFSGMMELGIIELIGVPIRSLMEQMQPRADFIWELCPPLGVGYDLRFLQGWWVLKEKQFMEWLLRSMEEKLPGIK